MTPAATDDRLPTFIVIGAMKAATSSLHAWLGRHPDVYTSEPKELDFFVDRRGWSRGVEWYRSCFEPGRRATARGESSPLYTMAHTFGGVPERMAGVVPDVRLVYVVRDPVDRMRSHYLHRWVEGADRRPIEVALREHAGYLETSRYAWQLDAYLEHFPRHQVLVVVAERLRDDRRSTLDAVVRFIGVDPARLPTDLGGERHRTDAKVVPRLGWGRVASAAWARRLPLPRPVRATARRLVGRPVRPERAKVPAALDRELRDRLAPDTDRLRAWLDDDIPEWRR